MNSNEIRIDEKACEDVIGCLKTTCESANEAYNLVKISSNHIDNGLRGSAENPIKTECNDIVTQIKKIVDVMNQDITAVKSIVSNFNEEDKKLAKSSIRR